MVVAFTPLSRLEDRKFGFLLRNKTISLNICIDVREVFNAKVTTIIITLTSMTTMSAMFALTDITTTLVTHVVYESVALLLDVTILLFSLFITIVIAITCSSSSRLCASPSGPLWTQPLAREPSFLLWPRPAT